MLIYANVHKAESVFCVSYWFYFPEWICLFQFDFVFAICNLLGCRTSMQEGSSAPASADLTPLYSSHLRLVQLAGKSRIEELTMWQQMNCPAGEITDLVPMYCTFTCSGPQFVTGGVSVGCVCFLVLSKEKFTLRFG